MPPSRLSLLLLAPLLFAACVAPSVPPAPPVLSIAAAPPLAPPPPTPDPSRPVAVASGWAMWPPAWTDAPSVVLGGARVWLALGLDGLEVAADVPGTDASRVALDVAFAFPVPDLPELGFEHQFGLSRVPNEEACASEEIDRGQVPDEAARAKCRAWYREQVARRHEIAAGFRRVYRLSSHGMTAAEQTIPGAQPTAVAEGGRVRLWGMIPAAALPLTGEAPVEHLLARVAIVGEAGVTSSSPASRDDDPTTWSATTLSPSLHFGARPALLERVATRLDGIGEGVAVMAYVPTRDASVVSFYLNEPRGYQWVPEAPSPGVQMADLGAWTPVARLGDVRVIEVDSAPGIGGVRRALATVRGDTLIELGPPREGKVHAAVARSPGLHVLEVDEGVQRYLAAGECGACPRVSFTVRTIDRAGHFVQALDFAGDGGGKPIELAPFFEGKLDAFGVRGVLEEYGAALTQVQYRVRHAYDPRTGKYETKVTRGKATVLP